MENKPNYTGAEILVAVFGLGVVLALTAPIKPVLFLPVLLFGMLGMGAFMRDHAHQKQATSTNKAVNTFRAVALVGIAFLVLYGVFVAVLLSSEW